MSLFWDEEIPLITEKKVVKKSHTPLVCDDKGLFGCCKITRNMEEAIEWLGHIKSWKEVAFDYETTGLKPHKPGHEIVAISFSNGEVSYAFPVFKEIDFRSCLWGLLGKPHVKKIAHNIRFEASWTFNVLKYELSGIYWDTMIAEHCLNNTSKIGLKYLAEKYFGVANYEADMSCYLECSTTNEDKDGKNGFNSIFQAPIDKLLLYNAMDSLLTFKLYLLQKAKLNGKLKDGFHFLMEGVETLRKFHENGIKINPDILEVQKGKARRKMERVEWEISESEEVKLWDGCQPFNFNSNKDLPHLLFDIAKIQPVVFTDGGKPSVDEEALGKIKSPLTEKILEWRKWKKASGTYLSQFEREQVDGVVRSYLNLNTVDTFRSSGDSPNIQNIYKRDPEMKKFIRSFIVPTKGNRFIEYDYKAAEVCVSACYNKDPKLLEYVRNPGSDMHRDVGCQLFFRTPETLTKAERGTAKNGFVFPVFYGSYFKNTAPSIWEQLSEETIAHLKCNGIGNLIAFTRHVEKIEKDFWNNRFPVYAKWKNEQWDRYEKNGFVELYTGFRCTGRMDKKQTSNYPIQGSAFHCLLWYAIEVQKEIEKRKMKSRLIYEIHDALVADVVPEEEAELDRLVWDYGTQKIRAHWPWIIVPLTIEKERSAVDGSWAVMEGCGVLKF